MAFSTVPASEALSADLLSQVVEWASHRRWYPGEAGSRPEPWLVGRWEETATAAGGATGIAQVFVLFARLGTTVLQIPLLVAPGGLGEPITTTQVEGEVYDGASQPAVWRAYLGQIGTVTPESLTDGKLLPGEQSNSSVLLPNWKASTGPGSHAAHTGRLSRSKPPVANPGAMMKILRTLAPGEHPDVTVPKALTKAGFDGVPAFLGAAAVTLPKFGETDLAILAELVTDAEDGFELAVKYAAENRDFAELAASFGATLAGLHLALAEALPSKAKLDPDDFIAHLETRADAAVADAPSLVPLRAEIDAKYADLAEKLRNAPPQPLQHIHGDLHLGQVLYGPAGWRILDFEGEPLRPVAERTAPDSPLRDVAGMLRSFDYAAAVGQATDPNWAGRAQDAFLAAYLAEASGARDTRFRVVEPVESRVVEPVESRVVEPVETTRADLDLDILRALTLDKALYEVVYETRQRPNWVKIPLTATQRLLRGGY